MKRPIIVDTQLLVLLVVGATDASLIAQHRRTLSYTRGDFHFLLDSLGNAPRFLFCPHVAAEASNLIGQHREPDRSVMMHVLRALLNNASEARITCGEAMAQAEYVPLGMADAAQLALYRDDAVLLTDDEKLYRAASARGAAALYFREERSRRGRYLA